jgi:murein DD-endopeptidase MepM/ murein hydrolase activator NlpD
VTHKKNKPKFLNILLVPDDRSPIKKVRIRISLLIGFAVLLIVIFMGILVGIISFGSLTRKAYENIVLKEENQQLVQQIAKMNELAADVNQLKEYGERIQNTLKGYIKIADTPEEASLDEKTGNDPDKNILSIFNFIPLKAPVIGFISQEYNAPIHNGIDIVATEGTPIIAAAKGTVLYSDWNQDGGYTIILGHDQGYYTYYKHNLRNIVQNNQQVDQGQVIAYLGNSGRKSYGPHLHFEIWKDGRSLDPKEFIMEYN